MVMKMKKIDIKQNIKNAKAKRKKYFENDALFLENEYKSNIICAYILIGGVFLLLLALLLNVVGIFRTGTQIIINVTWQSCIELVVPAVVCLIFKGRKKWLKYLLLVMFVVVLARIDCVLGYNTTLLMLVPVIMSTRYCSKYLSIQVALATIVLFAFSTYCQAAFNLGVFDMNHYDITKEHLAEILNLWPDDINTLKQALNSIVRSDNVDIINKSQRITAMMLRDYVPKLFVYFLASGICIFIANNGHNMIVRQYETSQKKVFPGKKIKG